MLRWDGWRLPSACFKLPDWTLGYLERIAAAWNGFSVSSYRLLALAAAAAARFEGMTKDAGWLCLDLLNPAGRIDETWLT